MVNVYDSMMDSFAMIGVYKNDVDVTKKYFNFFEKGRDFIFYPFTALERRADDLRAQGFLVVILY